MALEIGSDGDRPLIGPQKYGPENISMHDGSVALQCGTTFVSN